MDFYKIDRKKLILLLPYFSHFLSVMWNRANQNHFFLVIFIAMFLTIAEFLGKFISHTHNK